MCTLRFIGGLAGACAALGNLLDPVGSVGATARFTDEARAAYLSATHLDLDRLRGLMADPVVVDLRNLYHPAGMQKAGLIYVGVGREACPRRTAIVSEAVEQPPGRLAQA